MRPSEIKVGELKKSKKLQTHAAKNSGMSTGFGDRRCGRPLLLLGQARFLTCGISQLITHI